MKKLFIFLLLLLPMMVMAQGKKVSSVVVAESNYVVRGGTYKAQLVPVSEDMKGKAHFFVNGKEIPNGKYSAVAKTVGPHKQRGYMLLGNDTTRYPFSFSYSVGEPSVTISNTDFNIMYRGYENKFAISVPGFPNDKIKVSVTKSEVRNKNGLWIIIPSDSARSVTVSVSAEVNGKIQAMGSREYRVRPLPAPQAYFYARDKEYASGSKISPTILAHFSGAIIASYGPDGLLNVPFNIASFAVTMNGLTINCEGNRFSDEVLNNIAKLKMGSSIVISDIKAVGPVSDQEIRLAPIVYTLK